jgi:hypothetical protein
MDTRIVSFLPRPVHWSARVTALLLLGLVIVIVIGHRGPPNIFGQPTPVQLEFAAMGLMLVGLVIGWVREGLGGLLVLLGLAALNTVELTVNGRPALRERSGCRMGPWHAQFGESRRRHWPASASRG